LLPTTEETIDVAFLLTVFEEMKGEAGQAPGIDGLSYSDVGRIEMAGIFRQLAQAVKAGTYRPYPYRLIEIPKPDSNEKRPLKLRIIADRVLARAVHIAMLPYWERIFSPRSHAWRPNRGVWTLLAELKIFTEELDSWVLVIDDIRKAFDNVNIARLLEHHALHIPDAQLVGLLESIFKGHEPVKEVGIDQGSAYSPTALNVHLHHAHDLAMDQGRHLFLRYADNLTYVCRNMSESRQVLAHARELLATVGLALKGRDAGAGKGPFVDLQEGDRAQLLGFELSYEQNQLILDLHKSAWDQLRKNLEEAHEAEDPASTAQSMILGWIHAYGPAFENVDAKAIRRLLETATQLGFREIASPDELRELWETSYREWRAEFQKAHQFLSRSIGQMIA